MSSNLQTIRVTIIRDHNGLGFSIAGGIGRIPYINRSQGIYIYRIAKGGAADKDGKLMVGDRVLSVNGTDVENLRQDQVMALLVKETRFVRLLVQREAQDVRPRLDSLSGDIKSNAKKINYESTASSESYSEDESIEKNVVELEVLNEWIKSDIVLKLIEKDIYTIREIKSVLNRRWLMKKRPFETYTQLMCAAYEWIRVPNLKPIVKTIEVFNSLSSDSSLTSSNQSILDFADLEPTDRTKHFEKRRIF